MNTLKRILILCTICAYSMAGWAQSYTAYPSTTDCVSPEPFGDYYRGYTKLSVSFSGNTANFTVYSCSGTFPANTTFRLKEASSIVTTSTTSGSRVSSHSFSYSLSFTSGTKYYLVFATLAGLETCTEAITITANSGGGGDNSDCTDDDYTITPTSSWNIDGWNVSSNGHRIYRFSATSGEKYTFKTGCGDGATASFDTRLYVYNSSCVQQASDDNTCESYRSKIENWTCPSSGYYYLKIDGHNGASGNYTLAYRKGSSASSFFDIQLYSPINIPSNMTVNQSYNISITVLNNTLEQFNGCFYLKEGNTNVLDWSDITINSSQTYTLQKTYTPTIASTKTLTLHHQANCNDDGAMINPGNYSNPITVTVTTSGGGGGSSPFDIQLYSPINMPSNMTVNQSYNISITVLNNTLEQFNGCFYLKEGNTNVLDWSDITINSSQTYTLQKTYTPTIASTKTLTLHHQANCNNDGAMVNPNGYSNPITVTVTTSGGGGGGGGGGGNGNCVFNDLPNTDKSYEATCYLYNKNILSGTASNYMSTEEPIVRLHIAKIAFRGVYSLKSGNVPSSVRTDNYPSVYSDLNISTAGNELQAAKALLYLEYGDGIAPFDRNNTMFKPEGNITRVDALKVLMETFDIQPDLSSTASYSNTEVNNLKNNNPLKFGYIYKAKNLGIIDDINTFRPFDHCKRGEAFLMLYRIMTKIEAGNITDPNPSNTDYFEPMNITLQNIAQGVGIELGNFNHYTKACFNMDGVVPLDFGFTYNSYNTELPDGFFGMENLTQSKFYTYQPLSSGWSHNYHSFVTLINPDGNLSTNSRAIVHWGGGVIHIYKSNSNGFVPESYGVYDVFNISENNVVTITTKSQIEYKFRKNISSATADGTLKLWTVKDRNGNTLTVNYEIGVDNIDRISSVSDSNRSLTFAYKSGTNLLWKVSDPLGRVITFDYISSKYANEGYILSGFMDAKGYETIYEYADAENAKRSKLLSKIRLPKGNSIENQYDEYRRLKQSNAIKDNMVKSKTEVYIYPSFESGSNPVNSTVYTFRNNASNYSYYYKFDYKFDANNNITQITGNQNLNVTAGYNDIQNPLLPTSITGNNSNIQDIQYDNRGNVTQITRRSITNSETRVVKMEYNSDNTLKHIIDPKNNTTYYDYDSNGNLIKIRTPENSTTNFDVNDKGLVIKTTNPENIVTEFDHNAYGNIRTVTIPALGISSTMDYDHASRVISVKDFMNRENSFNYDANDNLLSEVDALNRTTGYNYDANNNLTTITNAKEGVTSLNYDNVTDLLTSVSFGGSIKQYAYNDDGTVKTFTKPDGTNLQNSYDDLGRIINDGVNSYEYDNEHRLWKITKGGKTLQYTYDGFNQITGVTYDNKTVNYTYDNNGNISTITYPDNKTVTYTYDNLNRMKTVTDWNNKTITYYYLSDSRLQSVSYPNGMTLTYAYDNAGRQTGKTVKRSDNTVIASYNFTLDNVGNIITENRTEPYANISLPNENVSYNYNSANRITQAGNTSFTFDANGNTKTRGNSSYNYDLSDKLISGDGLSFEYDGLGNIRSNGNRRYWIDIMGMGSVIAETDMSNNPTACYLYGASGLEARILPNGTTEYYVSDYRGSVVAMVDASTSANITHKYQYDEFGKIIQQQENDANPFRYVGKHGVMYFGDNLYYMRARFYDPTIGRFLSEDPIWSTNLYPYVDNNPVMGIDPKGLLTLNTDNYKNKAQWHKNGCVDLVNAILKENKLNPLPSGLSTYENYVKNLESNSNQNFDDIAVGDVIWSRAWETDGWHHQTYGHVGIVSSVEDGKIILVESVSGQIRHTELDIEKIKKREPFVYKNTDNGPTTSLVNNKNKIQQLIMLLTFIIHL